jgi:hypothetical protein
MEDLRIHSSYKGMKRILKKAIRLMALRRRMVRESCQFTQIVIIDLFLTFIVFHSRRKVKR